MFEVCETFRDGGVAPTREMPCSLWEPRPRGDWGWFARLFATGASLLQGRCSAVCGSPALGAIVGGLRGFSRRGRRSYKGDALQFVGAPPSGRLWVVCGAFRDGGVAPTRGMPCSLWEPRPRGDWGWFARLFATGASLLRGRCLAVCGSPALGAIVGGLRGFSRRGRRSYKGDALQFVGASPSGRLGVVCEAFRDGGVAPTRAMPCSLWEPRPRGDCGWFARLFATGASLLQKSVDANIIGSDASRKPMTKVRGSDN